MLERDQENLHTEIKNTLLNNKYLFYMIKPTKHWWKKSNKTEINEETCCVHELEHSI